MALIVAGRRNKQVSYALGISEITVETHRAKMMRKMKAGCFANLVRMASRLCLTPVLKVDRRSASSELEPA
jgi:FixJ family two-component response regulator